MIIANDQKWVICTPPKTGTVSLQNCLVPKYAQKSVYRHEASYTGRGVRILVVRHPLERWASLYWRKRQKALGGKTDLWLGDVAHDIVKYTSQWISARSSNTNEMYTWNQVDFVNHFKPTYFFRLEDQSYKDLLKFIKVREQLPHANKTGDKKGWVETSKLMTKAQMEFIVKWALADLTYFGYEGSISTRIKLVHV